MKDLPLSKVYQLLEPEPVVLFYHSIQRPTQHHGDVMAQLELRESPERGASMHDLLLVAIKWACEATSLRMADDEEKRSGLIPICRHGDRNPKAGAGRGSLDAAAFPSTDPGKLPTRGLLDSVVESPSRDGFWGVATSA
ncbi:MAG: hypothetical protein ABR861_10800 [Terriglobales bacterium]|jgi:hypothetical protein